VVALRRCKDLVIFQCPGRKRKRGRAVQEPTSEAASSKTTAGKRKKNVQTEVCTKDAGKLTTMAEDILKAIAFALSGFQLLGLGGPVSRLGRVVRWTFVSYLEEVPPDVSFT
jgi:hypothetical protein